MTKYFCSEEFSAERVQSLRQAAITEVGQPPLLHQQILEGMEIYIAPRSHCDAPWLSWMAWKRDILQHSVLRLHHADGLQYVLFAYASQQPIFVCVSMLSVAEVTSPTVSPDEFFCMPGDFEFVFEASWEFKFSDANLFEGIIDVAVLLDATVLPGGAVAADGPWVPIAELQAQEPYSRGAGSFVFLIQGSQGLAQCRALDA